MSGILKMLMWYFEEGNVVRRRRWCGTSKWVVLNFEEVGVVLMNHFSFVCFNMSIQYHVDSSMRRVSHATPEKPSLSESDWGSFDLLNHVPLPIVHYI